MEEKYYIQVDKQTFINSLPDLTPAGFADTSLLPDLDTAAVSDRELSAWEYTGSLQDHLTNLLQTSSYGSPYKESIERDIDNMNMGEDEYYALLFNLQTNQMDPISHRGNFYSKRDINKYLKRFV